MPTSFQSPLLEPAGTIRGSSPGGSRPGDSLGASGAAKASDLRVAYLFHRDAANPEVQSLRPLSILDQLEATDGVRVERVFPLRAPWPTPWALLLRGVFRALGRPFRLDREPARLRAYARQFEARVVGKPFDVVFCPGSEAISALPPGRWPVTFCADATFANMVGYYAEFSGLPERYLRQGHALERAALQRAALAVYPSAWAARSAVEDYGADPATVAVIPFGANLGADNEAAEVERWIERKPHNGNGPCELLFLGKDWKRKGGDLAVATVERLRASGLEARLHVVGCPVPAVYRDRSWVVGSGYLNPNAGAQVHGLEEQLQRAHFVFIPTRAEAYGMAFCEANAFGVPAVGTATGGVPEIIRDGVNGFLLPPEAGPDAYAELIAARFARPTAYRELARRSFREFETRLNWRVFCRRYLQLVRDQVLKVTNTAAFSFALGLAA